MLERERERVRVIYFELENELDRLINFSMFDDY